MSSSTASPPAARTPPRRSWACQPPAGPSRWLGSTSSESSAAGSSNVGDASTRRDCFGNSGSSPADARPVGGDVSGLVLVLPHGRTSPDVRHHGGEANGKYLEAAARCAATI